MNIGFKQERLRFTHGDRMRTYSDVINQATTESLDLHSGQIFDVRTVTQSITLRVIMQAVFGLDRGERAEQLEQVLKVQAIVRGAFA